MQEELTQEQVRAIARGEHVPKRPAKQPPVLAKGQHRERGTMNKGEARYALELESRLKAGAIRWFAFEAVKVRLADNTFITPDFAVIAADLFLEFHDVKGRKDDGYWCEEDARIKLKFLAEKFPARVKIVWPDKAGVWQSETI